MPHPSVIAIVDDILTENDFEVAWRMPNTNEEASSDGTTPWMDVQFPASNSNASGVSVGTMQEEGGVRFVLHIPTGEGTARAEAWFLELAGQFRYIKRGTFQTFAPTPPFFDDTNDEGGWYAASVVVPYLFHYSNGD